jgi:hypothetical protein
MQSTKGCLAFAFPDLLDREKRSHESRDESRGRNEQKVRTKPHRLFSR